MTRKQRKQKCRRKHIPLKKRKEFDVGIDKLAREIAKTMGKKDWTNYGKVFFNPDGCFDYKDGYKLCRDCYLYEFRCQKYNDLKKEILS